MMLVCSICFQIVCMCFSLVYIISQGLMQSNLKTLLQLGSKLYVIRPLPQNLNIVHGSFWSFLPEDRMLTFLIFSAQSLKLSFITQCFPNCLGVKSSFPAQRETGRQYLWHITVTTCQSLPRKNNQRKIQNDCRNILV